MQRSIHGYEIIRALASQGGMSSIYLGIKTSLDQKVAIKVLHEDLLKRDRDNFVTRFELEAKRMAKLLSHPNIVSVLDYGHEDDQYYIIMEYIEGIDARRALGALRGASENQGPRSCAPEIVLIVLDEVAKGLEAAHELAIVHRDVKPHNILLSFAGDVKIADFGIAYAQIRDDEENPNLTVDGHIVGTPSYMSPEHAQGLRVDHRTDVFSLGIVAFELLTGTRPFVGRTPSEIRERVILQPPPPVTDLNPHIPDVLAQLVDRMLQKSREARYPTMKSLRADIGRTIDAVAPDGALFRHRREWVADFVADPEGFNKKVCAASVDEHLGRAARHLEHSRLDTAMREYRYVLWLDPNHSEARRRLAELETEGMAPTIADQAATRTGGTTRTEARTKAKAPGVAAAAVEAPRAGGAEPRPSRRRRPLAGAAALALVAAVAFWWGRQPNGSEDGRRAGLGQPVQSTAPDTVGSIAGALVASQELLGSPVEEQQGDESTGVDAPGAGSPDVESAGNEAEGNKSVSNEAAGKESVGSPRTETKESQVEARESAAKPAASAPSRPRQEAPAKRSPPPARGTLVVHTNEPCDVLVDGEVAAQNVTEARLDLVAAQAHRLSLSHPTYGGRALGTVQVEAGVTHRLPPIALGPTRLRVFTVPPVAVALSVNGTPRDWTPQTLALEAGTHQLAVEHQTYRVVRVEVDGELGGPRQWVPAAGATFEVMHPGAGEVVVRLVLEQIGG